MQSKRTQRAALGAVSLVVVALAMGWFVGRYIPGTPHGPESVLLSGMYDGNGTAVEQVVEYPFNDQARLEKIVQGVAFTWEEDRYSAIDETGDAFPVDEYIEHLKQTGDWEYEYPSFEMRIDEARAVSGSAFAELHPDYYNWDFGYQPTPFQDSTIVLVSATVTNTSDETISGSIGSFGRAALPNFWLWTDTWADFPVEAIILESGETGWEAGPLSDGSLGSGATFDFNAFHLINEYLPLNDPAPEGPQTAPISLEPGEMQTLVLPFTVANKALENGGTGKNLDLSRFCIQTVDYRTATAYRLELK
ncbi:hypothetical protein [Raoultibacter phocaeensis]|uniref:hypothetical protein n=1 Tax=Raoultibacter phocaeensis TaxID=2479841 RepID=UPI0011199895|nr:hypothetical protein [Raoultibacter phocaeensis]